MLRNCHVHLNLALELKRVMYFCILRVCSPFFWIFPCSPGRGWLLREHASFPLGAFTSGSFFCTRSSGTAGVEGGRLRKGLRQEKPEPTGDQDSRRSGVEYRPVRSPGCKFWSFVGLAHCGTSSGRATTLAPCPGDHTHDATRGVRIPVGGRDLGPIPPPDPATRA